MLLKNPQSLNKFQIIVRICLFLFAAIGIFGGTVQIYLGQPHTIPRLDNIHRFMAGIYFTTGIINLWAAITIKKQGTLVYLLAFGAFLGGIGRLISIYNVGIPQPTGLWIGYLTPELILPIIIVICHYIGTHQIK